MFLDSTKPGQAQLGSVGTLNSWDASAFTQGSVLPWNLRNTLELFVYKRTTQLFFQGWQKVETISIPGG